MRILFVFASLVFLLIPAVLNAEVNFGISATDEGIESFYLAIGSHYNVPHHEIREVHARHIPDEELPVVFFFAAHAHVQPAVIIDLRLRHKTWHDISVYYNLSPEIYYVPVETKRIGPHHGKAYGHYKNRPHKHNWRKLKLSDREVVDLVNLKFMSEYHQYPSEQIIQMRGDGKKFHIINNDIVRWKKGHKDKGEYDYHKKDDYKPKDNYYKSKNKHRKKPEHMNYGYPNY